MQVKLLSWNIWVDSHFKKVKDFLKDSEANIISLQEVSENDPSRDTVKFLKSLGYDYVFSPTKKDWSGDLSYGPAIFTNFDLVASKKYVLSKEDMNTTVRADIKIGKSILTVFSTHLSHTHQKDSIDQLHQVETILKFIPSRKSVLTGDFNSIPKSKTIQKVREKLVDTDLKNLPTWSVYPEGCVVCKPQKIDIRLDYIFTTKDVKTHSYKVEYSNGSDHLPISVVLEI